MVNPDLYNALIVFSVIGAAMIVFTIAFIIKKWVDSKTTVDEEKSAQKEKVTDTSKKSEKKEQISGEMKEEITMPIKQMEQKEISEDKEKMLDIPNTFGMGKITCAGCRVILRISTVKRPVAIECPKCGVRMNLL